MCPRSRIKPTIANSWAATSEVMNSARAISSMFEKHTKVLAPVFDAFHTARTPEMSRALQSLNAVQEKMRGHHEVLTRASSVLAKHAESAQTVAGLVSKALEPSKYDASMHVLKGVDKFWRGPRIESFGVMTTFNNLQAGGGIVWDEEGESQSLIWSPRALERPGVLQTLHITHEVKCMLCDHVLATSDHAADWVSASEVKTTVRVLPLCAPCQERMADDPNYFKRRLMELGSPQLRLVPGGGEGSGRATGVLTLAYSDDAADDD